MKILKTELKKAFDSPGFVIALIIGFGCVFYKNYLIIKQDYYVFGLYKEMGRYININAAPFYDRWIIGYIDSSILYIFYFLGIIAALPYGISYLRDKKIGIIKNICTRCDKKKYLFSKYISVFIVGGTASAFPIICDFLMANLYQPYDSMRIEGSILCSANDWGMFIIDYPYVGAVIMISIWFIFGGALATISLLISVIADNIFTVQLTPFFVMLALFYIPSAIPVKYGRYFPFSFLTLFNDSSPFVALVVSVIIMCFTFNIFMFFENKKDIL